MTGQARVKRGELTLHITHSLRTHCACGDVQEVSVEISAPKTAVGIEYIHQGFVGFKTLLKHPIHDYLFTFLVGIAGVNYGAVLGLELLCQLQGVEVNH